MKIIQNKQTGKFQERISLAKRRYIDPVDGSMKYGEQDAQGFYYMRDLTDEEEQKHTIENVFEDTDEEVPTLRKYNILLITDRPTAAFIHDIESGNEVCLSEYAAKIGVYRPIEGTPILDPTINFDFAIADDMKTSIIVNNRYNIPVVSVEAVQSIRPQVFRIFIEYAIDKQRKPKMTLPEDFVEPPVSTIRAEIAKATLFPVVLQKTDTCWTYALRRIGGKYKHLAQEDTLFIELPEAYISTDHNMLEEYFDKLPLMQDELGYYTCCSPTIEPCICHPDCPHPSRLQIGDLLLFTHAEGTAIIADGITAEGVIEYTSDKIRRHVGVYEGNGRMSHATYNFSTFETKSTLIGMQIAIISLADLQHQPTHVLKLKAT